MAFTLSKIFGQIRNTDPLLEDVSVEALWSGPIGAFSSTEPQRPAGAGATSPMDYLIYGELGRSAAAGKPPADALGDDAFGDDALGDDALGGDVFGGDALGGSAEGGMADLLGLSPRSAPAEEAAASGYALPARPARGEHFAMLVHHEGSPSVAELNDALSRGWRVGHLASLPGTAKSGAALVVLYNSGN